MEFSKLALGQQKRSHNIEQDVHTRRKRALSEDYNGGDGQVLLADIETFQGNLNTHLGGLPNCKFLF